MNHSDVPLDRLQFFQGQLGLTAEEMALLESHRDVFLASRDEFAGFLHGLLSGIPETRRIVDLMESRGGLQRNWRCWYEGLFTQAFNPQFYEFLWSSGLRHLDRGVDQRFIHLGYCTARLFLGQIIEREIPAEERHAVRSVVDKMVDQCLLVATDAFLVGTTQCDREVINGIAHQVRNPLMVIGGFIHTVQKKVSPDSPVQSMLGTMLEETQRLEQMVENVGTFIEIMQREPEFKRCALGSVLDVARESLREEGRLGSVEPKLELGEALAHPLDSDPHLLELLFYQLLRNALEAAREAPSPRVHVTGAVAGTPVSVLTVRITNNGRVPSSAELEHLFTPFYSSRPTASGFGLPIAALIVRKMRGEIDLRPSEEGTLTSVSLPVDPT